MPSEVRTFDLGRIMKADGEPFVGARVFIHDGVADDGPPQELAELFADEDCTEPLANPLIVCTDGSVPEWFIRATESFVGVTVQVRAQDETQSVNLPPQDVLGKDSVQP